MTHKLREWRRAKGFTIAQVAERLDVLPEMLSKWERGKHVPKAAYIEAIYTITAGEVEPNDFFELKLPAVTKRGVEGNDVQAQADTDGAAAGDGGGVNGQVIWRTS